MRRLARAALIAVLFSTAALAEGDAYLLNMCTQMASWPAKELAQMPDAQLERAVCLSAKANFRAASTNDKVAERRCTEATRHLVIEFNRRWPQREAKEVVGKC